MSPPQPKLSRIDLAILSCLQQNGRITNLELSERIGLSPSPCLMRVKRLEKSGYIVGYGAQIGIHKLGDTVTVFTEVTLGDHRVSDFSRFETKVSAVPEVVECHLVSGGYDYLLKFITRSIQHYQEVIETMLAAEFGIEKYYSYIVIKSVMVKPGPDIAKLFPPAE